MKMLLGIIIAAGLTFAPPASASTATLQIEGMTCGGCAAAVKLVLQKTPGVSAAKVSYEDKQAVVTFDSGKTNPQKIAAAVADALSYKVSVMSGATSTIALGKYRAETLREEFNRASDRVRVVALLSPTCGACQKGQRVVEAVFSKYPNDARLRGFVIWLPMLATDSAQAAGAQASAFVDPRIVQQWDGDRASGAVMAKTLGLKGTAWDIYLLYAPGVRWTGDVPPQPTFWMHQLRAETGADQRICLNPAVFTNKGYRPSGHERMSCCETDHAIAGDGNCVSCGTKAVQVPIITAKALMTAEGLRGGVPQAPRFCASPGCEVVYFDDVSARRVPEGQLTVVVYAKHSHQADTPVCYCFGYTVGMIERSRVDQTTPVSQLVRAEVEAGHCACEVKNPKGACCLGDITRIERA